MARPKLVEPHNDILRLYGKGLTQREIAKELKMSITTIWTHLQLINIQRNYFKDLVEQCVYDLTHNFKAYCFTLKQIKAIEEKYPHFEYGILDDCYVLYPKRDN